MKPGFGTIGALTSGSFPKPLSESEEALYLKKMKDGDEDAKNILIEHNLRLVAHIVKKYADPSDSDDLISIGTVGLIKGVGTFKPGTGTQLSTYCARCIENEILMYLRRNSKLRMEVSIDEPLNVDWDGNELLLSDILGTDEDTIYRDMEQEAEKKVLFGAINRLSAREQTIIRMRFGLNDAKGEEKTQKEVADMLGISQSYISRLEKKIIKKANDGVKVLGNGELSKPLTVKLNAYTASAKEKIEKAGGKAEVI